MISKNFYFKIIFQIVLILITGCAAYYFYFKSNYVLLPLNISFIVVFQTVLLIRFINKFNKTIAFQLDSLINSDFLHIKNLNEKNKSFLNLNRKLKILYEKIEESELEKTMEHQYHRYSIEHVNVGLISYIKKGGEIKYINKVAKIILGINIITSIEKLKDISDDLYKTINTLNPGQAKLFKLCSENELVHLSIKMAEFKLLNEKVRLVSIQNIKNEIEENELESWQKLIRILTHEIMNSVAPIISATKSLSNFLTENGIPKKSIDVTDKLIEDSVLGLEAINVRSDGLLEFVEQYRNLTNLPKPEYTEFKVYDLINQVAEFLKADFDINNIGFSYILNDKEIELTADFKLIEQILINLLINSIYALEHTANKKIELNAYSTDEHIIIEIKDNGKGIPNENMDKIFIPFFTTREGGSGIGLSFVRQIMQLHNGTINVSSIINVGTTFQIKL